MKCEKCNTEMIKNKNGVEIIWKCPSCDCSFVTTDTLDICLDEKEYEIHLLEKVIIKASAINAIAKKCNMNVLKMKKILEQGQGIIYVGHATRVLEVLNVLKSYGLKYIITPEFPYVK